MIGNSRSAIKILMVAFPNQDVALTRQKSTNGNQENNDRFFKNKNKKLLKMIIYCNTNPSTSLNHTYFCLPS